MTTDKCVALFKVLNEVKLTKLSDADKYLIIKMLKKLRPIAENFEAYQKDAGERLKPTNWDEIIEKAQKWQQEGEETTLTDEEKKEINLAIYTYDTSVRNCVTEELMLEHEVEYKKISEEAFEKLLASNDWDAKTALFVSDEIVEEEVVEEVEGITMTFSKEELEVIKKHLFDEVDWTEKGEREGNDLMCYNMYTRIEKYV